MQKISGSFVLHSKIIGCDLITFFSGRKKQDYGTRLGERMKGRQNKEWSSKWKIKSEKITTINDDQIHVSHILIAQSLEKKHFFFKRLFASISK